MTPNNEAKYCPFLLQLLPACRDEEAYCSKRACEWWTTTVQDEGCAMRLNVSQGTAQVVINTRKRKA